MLNNDVDKVPFCEYFDVVEDCFINHFKNESSLAKDRMIRCFDKLRKIMKLPIRERVFSLQSYCFDNFFKMLLENPKNIAPIFPEAIQSEYKNSLISFDRDELESKLSIAAKSLNSSSLFVEKKTEIPKQDLNEYFCPISKDMMDDPVIIYPSLQVFDRDQIEQWVAAGGTKCPITRMTIELNANGTPLVSSHIQLKERIEKYKMENSLNYLRSID